MKKPVRSKTAELDKMAGVRDKSQSIGAFLDWLRDTKKWQLAAAHEHQEELGCYDDGDLLCQYDEEALYPALYNTENLLAEFFGIDLKKVEEERRGILAELRKQDAKREVKTRDAATATGIYDHDDVN